MKENFDEVVAKINTTNDKLNAFNLVMDYKEPKKSDSPLYGEIYALKDNYSTKGIRTTACSDTMKNYVPVFNSTVYEKLEDAGMIMAGKTNLDELAMGGTGTTGNTGVVHNPYDLTRIAGGSSAGSAACVAAGIVKYAIGSDTGDSVRNPAACCGIVGFKPSYGLISRYGLFPFASSLDHVGVFATNVENTAKLVDVLKGYDPKDMTSIKDMDDVKLSECEKVSGKKLFFLEDVCNPDNYENEETKEILNKFHETLDMYRNNGFVVEGVNIDFDLLRAIKPVYDCLSSAEASSNDSNLTGILFGPRGEGTNVYDMMKDHRTKGFSSLIKRRFVIGSFVLQKENQEKYFFNAMRARRLIVEKFNELFKEYDGFIMPARGTIASKIENATNFIGKTNDYVSILDNHLAIGNYGGYPSITIPYGFVNDMPVGLNITGMYKNDKEVLNIAHTLESLMDYKDMIKEVK